MGKVLSASSESDPEIISVVSVFKSSDFKFVFWPKLVELSE